MKVLLVDDEIDFVTTLANRLGMRGIEADVVHDGQQAIDYVAKNEPDIIILDHEMPRVHGMDVLRSLSKTNPKIQVVILTAFGTDARRQEADSLNAYDFLSKPVDIDLLTQRIQGAYKFKMEKTMAAAALAEGGDYEGAKDVAKDAKRFKTAGELFKKKK